MTREEALLLVKLLSALETCLLVSKVHVPDHLWDVFSDSQERLERELFKDKQLNPTCQTFGEGVAVPCAECNMVLVDSQELAELRARVAGVSQ